MIISVDNLQFQIFYFNGILRILRIPLDEHFYFYEYEIIEHVVDYSTIFLPDSTCTKELLLYKNSYIKALNKFKELEFLL